MQKGQVQLTVRVAIVAVTLAVMGGMALFYALRVATLSASPTPEAMLDAFESRSEAVLLRVCPCLTVAGES